MIKAKFPLDFNQVNQAVIKRKLANPIGFQRDTGGKQQSSASYGNKTFHTTFLSNSSFYAAQIFLFNANNSGQSITGFKASLATSANADNPYLPTDGVGAFKEFSFAASSIPPAQAAAGNFFQNFVPGIVSSNVMYFDVPPAHKQQNGSVVCMVRNYAPTLNTGANFDLANYNDRQVTVKGVTFGVDRIVGGNAAGDAVTSTGTFTRLVSGAAIPEATGAFGLKLFFDKPQTTIMTVGDSTMEGVGSTSGIAPSVKYAAQYFNSIGKVVSFYNAGFGGASNAQSPTTVSGNTATLQTGFLAQFIAYLQAGIVPQIAVYLSLSSNNSGFKTEGTAYTADAAREAAYYTEVFLSICRQFQIEPIVVTPGPNPDITTAQQETFRRAAAAAIRDVCKAGQVTLVDRDLLFTNFASATGGFLDPADSRNNSVHPSEQGHLKEAALFVDALSNFI